jgi:hypothetical protein
MIGKWIFIVQAVGCLMAGMGFGMMIRDRQNAKIYDHLEHKVVYTIDLGLIGENEDIDDFINRAHIEKLGVYKLI